GYLRGGAPGGAPAKGARTNGSPQALPARGATATQPGHVIEARQRFARWEAQLEQIDAAPPPAVSWPDGRRIVYVLRASETAAGGQLSVDIAQQDVLRDGSWGKPKPFRFGARLVAALPDARDREILAMILGSVDPYTMRYDYQSGYGPGTSLSGAGLTVPPAVCTSVLSPLCRTGRAFLRETDEDEPLPLTLDDGPPWELCIRVAATPDGRGYEVNAVLRRDGASLDLAAPAFLLAGGYVVTRDGTVAGLQDFGAFGWVSVIRRGGPLFVPAAQADEFLTRVIGMRGLPRVEIPPDLEYEKVLSTPQPRLRVTRAETYGWNARTQLTAALSFEYQGSVIEAGNPARGVFRDRPRRLLVRDGEAEAEAGRLLA
ncbi:MAG: hypothetical protein ACRDKW_13105, partial [Actinomycetota bacterium]